MIQVNNHYWAIGGSTTEVYSSASNTMVPVTDAAYVEWAKANNTGRIGSVEEMVHPLEANGTRLPGWLLHSKPTFIQPTTTTYTQEQLASYTADARQRKVASDIFVNGIRWSTDPLTFGSLNSAYIYTIDKQSNEFAWKLPDGGFLTLNTADIKALQDAANTFAQNCFKCEDTTLDGIEAGTVTGLDAIDVAFNAINNSFTGLRDAKELKLRHGPHRAAKPAPKKK